jgi:hypothetical protein
MNYASIEMFHFWRVVRSNTQGEVSILCPVLTYLYLSFFLHASSSFIVIQKRLDDLHNSQVKAYREAGTKAIQEWASGFPLEPMEEGDSEQTFVDRCVSALVGGGSSINAAKDAVCPWPNWKLDNAKDLASSEVRKRAKSIYEKYHPSAEEEDGDENNEDAGGTDECEAEDADEVETGDEIEEEEDDEDEEDGEEEDGEVGGGSNTASKTKQQQQPKNSNRNKRKGAGGNAKATTARKKANNAKGYRNKGGQATRGGRRGGRGGGGGNRKAN